MIAKPFRFAGFVGRRDELAYLRTAVECLSLGRGATIVLNGDRGIGKTRLLQEWLLTLERSFAFSVGARPILMPDIRKHAGIVLAESILWHPLQIVTPRDIGGRAGRKTVLLYEDIWDASPEVLRSLEEAATLATLNPWLVIATCSTGVTSQKGRVSRTLLHLEGLGASRIFLEPLCADEMQLLLRSGKGASRITPDVLSSIAHNSYGNPRLAEELLSLSFGSHPNPLAYSETAGSLALVSSEARAVLNAASIFVQGFTESMLAALLHRSDEQIAATVQTLIEAYAIEPVLGEKLYRFCSNLDRSAVYERLSPTLRRNLHAAAAELLDDTADPVEIAWHAFKGERDDRFTLIEQAARYALSEKRYTDVVELLQATLGCNVGEDLSDFTSLMFEALRKSGAGYFTLKPWHDRVAASDDDTDAVYDRYLVMIRALVVEGKEDEFRDAIQRALDLPVLPTVASVRLRMTIADHCAQRDDFGAARTILSSLPQPLPDDPYLDLYCAKINVLVSEQEPELTDKLYALESAIDRYTAAIGLDSFAASCINAYIAHTAQHLSVQGAASFIEPMSRAIGDLAARGDANAFFAVLSHAEVQLAQGDYLRARQTLRTLLAQPREEMLYRACLAVTAIPLGLELGDDVLLANFEDEDVIEWALRANNRELRGRLADAFCTLYVRRRQPQRARSLIGRVLATAGPVDPNYFIALAAARFGSTAQLEAARDLVQHSPWRGALHDARAQLFRAFVAWRGGHRGEAIRLARQACEVLESAGWRYYAAIRDQFFVEKSADVHVEKTSPKGVAPVTLTQREEEVARLAAQEKSNREIARALQIREKTVENHLRNAFAKLDIRSRWELKYHVSRSD